MTISRRDLLRLGVQTASAAATFALLPASIQKALAIPAAVDKGTLDDVKHIVILMQENRSFDHYFGTLRGVRGFGDRFPIPLASGKPVWYESNGQHEVSPFHLNMHSMNAVKIHSTSHTFADSQAAWGQGRFGFWPQFKIDLESKEHQDAGLSMGYYTRTELPFQYALADAFTLCDAYHCSVQSGTDPNRVMFWSGANFDPRLRAKGINCTDAHSEPLNLRCWVSGTFPDPGYTYRGTALTWPTIPEVLEKAGVKWRIYQNPNDNWTGAMHGCLAFEGFRNASPESSIYRNGMCHWSLEDLQADVRNNSLPAVSWILPSRAQSEHPGGSSPASGAEFTQQVLDALTSNPEVWSKTVLFLTFDENDGLFDHLPPPAVPSYNDDGTLAGKSTVDVDGMYFVDDKGEFRDDLMSELYSEYFGKSMEVLTRYRDPRDTVGGALRPWGMGPRVPMYIISPWSRGGWVNSQVFDHTSIGQFIEQRFNVTIPAITPWHRAVSGDLTTAFDFATPNHSPHSPLPDTSNPAKIEQQQMTLPAALPPSPAQGLYQEQGTRPSRALPYELHVDMQANSEQVTLTFHNKGQQGAVFHVYDKLHLERIPRRYTVEAGKSLSDSWAASDDDRYELEVFAPNGFFRCFTGALGDDAEPRISLHYDVENAGVRLKLSNASSHNQRVSIRENAYLNDSQRTMLLAPGQTFEQTWPLEANGHWYDFSVHCEDMPAYLRRFAGRMETGKHSISDPAMATTLAKSTG